MNTRDRSKEQLGRLVQGVDRSGESRKKVAELAAQLADPANCTYDRSADGLVRQAARV